MKKISTLGVGAAAAILVAVSFASPAFATNGHGEGHTPVTICHATASESNPYVVITVDDDSTKAEGHLSHEGDKFLEAGAECPTPVAVEEPPVEIVPPVVVPEKPPVVVEEPPVEIVPPVIIISDPPPFVLCLGGEEVSNGQCAPADLPCPGQVVCPATTEPPVTTTPPIPTTPPATVTPPAVTPPVTLTASPTTVAPPTATRTSLAETGSNVAGLVTLGLLFVAFGVGAFLYRRRLP